MALSFWLRDTVRSGVPLDSLELDLDVPFFRSSGCEPMDREVLLVGVGGGGGTSRWPWPRALPRGLWESLGWCLNVEPSKLLWATLQESMSC